ncbi:hypothetical protein BDD14_5656 [Edaphobacter modestus]|uniref:Resolvase HTH domain-containing protein n=1 Tax=Edaphobacter modestus TaxID=388466 RepID=A0A4Q7YFN7_9BACT|nr:hypothetical protein BDD14_5656 [Edaphobacter modestus]
MLLSAPGRKRGGQYTMTSAKLRLAMTAMGQQQTVGSELCIELGVTRQTLYLHIGPDGSLREDGKSVQEDFAEVTKWSVVCKETHKFLHRGRMNQGRTTRSVGLP